MTSVQSYAGTAVALHVQRPRPALLPAARAEPGRPPGDARRQGGPRRAEPRHREAHSRRARSRRRPRSARAFRSSRCRRARRCCRRWSPRSTGRTPNGGSSWRGPSARRSSRRQASSTWTGTSSRRGRSGGSTSTREKAARPDCPAPTWSSVVQMAGERRAPPGCCTTPPRAKTCRSCCACRGRSADRSTRRRPSASGRTPIAVGELTRADAGRREEQSIYHKNLQPVTYVTGDVAGHVESPVYAILQMNRALASLRAARGLRARDLQHAPAVRHARSTR